MDQKKRWLVEKSNEPARSYHQGIVLSKELNRLWIQEFRFGRNVFLCEAQKISKSQCMRNT